MTEAAGQVDTKSVLFTDLVGSTELRVRLGEDDADALRRAHDGLLGEVVASHGGTVVKGLGDGILATFDSAADAVGAAVAIQQAVEAHGRRVTEQAFEVKVGVSIGDVSSEAGDVFGVPVVEAARLCSVATGGEILAAEFVRVLSRGRGGFVFEPMGDIDLKGLPDPVPTCRVAWQPVAVSPERADEAPIASAPDRVPLPASLVGGASVAYVGRTELLAQLEREWRAANAGRTRAVLLAGEPGVGKTRTAAELVRRVHAGGGLVLYGRCEEGLGAPYQPFTEALDFYTAHTTNPALGRFPGELIHVLPDLAQRVSGLPAVVASDPGSEEHRLFQATTSWIVDAAAADGLVLVLDDLHWATKPTLLLTLHLLRAASEAGARLLVVVTYRDTDIDRSHPLSGVLADLRRLPAVVRSPVDNLSADEVMAFVTASAGHVLDAALSALADAVYRETEGNPFFVAEVLRHFVETGAVRREGDRWVSSAPTEFTIPEGVRDVVGRRLSRLSPTANEVLLVAAVLGREIDVDVLVALTDVGDAAVLDALDEAVRARLVEEVGADRFRFGHALVRATLYEELSATRRRRLHRRVADVLEKLHPTDVVALAHHCTEGGPEGGDVSRAVRYTLAAAEQSLIARAFADAEVRFHAALELLEDAEEAAPSDWVVALTGLGEAQREHGNPAFRQTLFDATRRALELGDVGLVLRAVLANSRGFASVVGDTDLERIEFIEQAIELVGTSACPERARLLALLACELTYAGGHARRLALVDEAEAMARSLGDDALLANVLVTTGYAFMSGPRWERLVARTTEGVRLADTTGDPTLRVLARVFQSAALMTVGDLTTSAAVTLEMKALGESEGSPSMRWIAATNAIRLSLIAGRLTEAATLNDECLAAGTESDEPDAQQWWAAVLVGISWLQGTAGDLADSASAFADQYPGAQVWRAGAAWMLAEAGRDDEARAAIYDHGLDPDDGVADSWPFTQPYQLAEAAFALGDTALARRVVDVLTAYEACWAHYYLVMFGPVTEALGLAHATLGEYDQAIALLERALAALVELDCVAYLPPMRMRLAMVLRCRGNAGDAERAAALLADARTAAVAIGEGGVIARVDALLSQA